MCAKEQVEVGGEHVDEDQSIEAKEEKEKAEEAVAEMTKGVSLAELRAGRKSAKRKSSKGSKKAGRKSGKGKRSGKGKKSARKKRAKRTKSAGELLDEAEPFENDIEQHLGFRIHMTETGRAGMDSFLQEKLGVSSRIRLITI
jgi:hypothetical protein